MKKLIAILLISVLISLCGCQNILGGLEGNLSSENEGTQFLADEYDTCYYTLNDTQQQMYKVLYTCAMDMPVGFVDVCDNYKDAKTDIGIAYLAMLYDNPQIFWMPRTYITANTTTVFEDTFSVAFKYSDEDNNNDYLVSRKERDDMVEELDQKVEDILALAPTSSDGFDEQVYFNDYICLNTEYEDNADFSDTVYGALLKGKASCEGYAKSFKLLCNLTDIKCELTVGFGEDEPHMWNTVLTDDNYAYTDVTWNDNGQDVGYVYFNQTEEEILKSHTIDPLFSELTTEEITEKMLFNFNIRSCVIDANNYYKRMGYVLSGDYVSAAAAVIEQNYMKGAKSQGFLLEDGVALEFERRKNGFILPIQTALTNAVIEEYTYDNKVLTLFFAEENPDDINEN